MTERERVIAQEAAAIMADQREWIRWLLVERAEMLHLIERCGSAALLAAAQLQLEKSQARLAVLSRSPDVLLH